MVGPGRDQPVDIPRRDLVERREPAAALIVAVIFGAGRWRGERRSASKKPASRQRAGAPRQNAGRAAVRSLSAPACRLRPAAPAARTAAVLSVIARPPGPKRILEHSAPTRNGARVPATRANLPAARRGGPPQSEPAIRLSGFSSNCFRKIEARARVITAMTTPTDSAHTRHRRHILNPPHPGERRKAARVGASP